MLSIAFEGNACRAAFHIGVARELFDRGVRPDIVAGASSGSLVAAAWAAGALDTLEERWLELIASARPFDLGALKRGRWPGRMSHVLRDGLERDHGAVMLADVPMLRVAVTRLGVRGRRAVHLGPDTDLRVVDAVLASCFIPGPYSRPVFVGRRPAVDGAWVARVPIDALPIGSRVAVVGDELGRLRAGLIRERPVLRPDDVEVIHPTGPLRAQGFVFDPVAAREAIDHGREVGAAWVIQHGM